MIAAGEGQGCSLVTSHARARHFNSSSCNIPSLILLRAEDCQRGRGTSVLSGAASYVRPRHPLVSTDVGLSVIRRCWPGPALARPATPRINKWLTPPLLARICATLLPLFTFCSFIEAMAAGMSIEATADVSFAGQSFMNDGC